MATQPSKLVLIAKAHYAAAPAKCTTLAVLFAAFLVVVTVQILNRPRSASASQEVPINTPFQSQQVDPDFIQMAMPGLDSVVAEDLPAFKDLPTDLPESLERDLFAISWEDYPPIVAANLGNQDDLSADNPEEENESGPGLVLEATYLGSDHMTKFSAVISGRIVHVNETIGRYVLTAIEPRRVVLSDGEEQVILGMP